MSRILIVEDEPAMASGLKFNFEQEGFDVVLASDGESALRQFGRDQSPFDLVILDLMLPGMSGYEICQQIRQRDNDIPVLVLSARTLSEDKAQAFDCGSDQYMTKPFALNELLSRARNLIERRQRSGTAPAKAPDELAEFHFGDVHVDFRRFEVTRGGEVHRLTSMELQLLRYFIEHEDFVLSRAQILEDVWDQSAEITTRSIDNFVMRLRKIIEPDPAEPRHILSVRGTGYRFVAASEDATNDDEATQAPVTKF